MAVHAISGAAGEVVQIAALYPLDTIKVRTDVVVAYGMCVPDATDCGTTAQSPPQGAALLSSFGAATGASSGRNLGGVTQHRCPCIVPPTCIHRCPLRCVGEVSGAGPEDVGAPARAAWIRMPAVRVPGPVRRSWHRCGGFGGHRSLLPPQVPTEQSYCSCLARTGLGLGF